VPVVLLVRHGQASFGAADYDVLSATGHRQGEVLRAGRARRAGQQGTAAAALPGEPVRVDPRWDEYDHLGLVDRYPPPPGAAAPDGSSRSVQALLDGALLAWQADPDGGWAAFAGGATDALRELVTGLDGRDAVVFTSGGVIAAVCASLLGLDAAGLVALNRVTVNGAITKLVVGRGGVHLVSFNDHAHFEGPDRSLLTYR
jgi:broad specificity phosphatase PhoE